MTTTEINNEYQESLTKNSKSLSYFNSFNKKKADSNFTENIVPTETPLFTKVQGGELRVLLPPGNGLGVIPFQIWFGGMWEVEAYVTNQSGDVLCSGLSNEPHHQDNPTRVFLPVPLPFPAEGTIYLVKCRFKRANYNPALQWEDATVGKRDPELSFAWWYPEHIEHPEPAANSKDGWAVASKIGF